METRVVPLGVFFSRAADEVGSYRRLPAPKKIRKNPLDSI
jgi:hypothetical protein